jgi:hypothetical protein
LGHPLNAKELAVPLLAVSALNFPNDVHRLPKPGTDATEAPNLVAEPASQDVVPLEAQEGALLIGVGIAGVKTVVAMIFHAQTVRDRPFGTGNFVFPLTDGLDHLPTIIATKILDTGLVLYHGILHDLRHRKHPRILPVPEVSMACTRRDLSRALETTMVVHLRLIGET